jgi:putative DNA methylase
MMEQCLREIHRILKPKGILTMVYAHKTVAGWSTLVNALRLSGFEVTEAWPMDTEYAGHLKKDTASLASSIFIVCRKRNNHGSVADYSAVKNSLDEIVQERVKTLWEQGITGADLIIACIGAGLKAFTQYEKVERENGEEISPERFLTEVEGVVQETILAYLFGSRAKVSSLDAPTRFYVLWRYAYGRGEIDAGEAIVFSYPLRVELDGPKGLGAGKSALLEKKGKKYRLRDFAERGQEDRLGLDAQFGLSEKPLVDVLHRLLWLMENRTLQIGTFLDAAMPHAEELRLVAQALSGSSLQGGGLKLTTDAEQGAMQKLLSNWESIIDDNLFRKK